MGSGLVVSVDESTRRMVEEMSEGIRETLEDTLRPVENDVSEILASQTGVMRLSRDMQQASRRLSDEMEHIADMLQGFLQSEEGIAQLSAVRTGQNNLLENFGRFWQSMESAVGFLSELSNSVAILREEQRRGVQAISSAVEQSAEKITECVREAGARSADEIRRVQESVGELAAAQEDGRRSVEESIAAIPQAVSASADRVTDAVRLSGEEVGGRISELAGEQQGAREDARAAMDEFREDARRMKEDLEEWFRAASDERGAQQEELVHLIELLRGEVSVLSEPYLLRWLKRREG